MPDVSLPAGARLGPYQITALIGAGGMGEVYRARDTNLARQIAIKVLPESVASDPERLARFDREAKTLAALNHPNIAAIYGLERADGQTALVMELVEGATLADRIAQGAIPVSEALPIAKQIAEALEAAHERGIVHRDLKPANVKVRPDGTVKVLDFGLAKALDAERSSAAAGSASMSPTITTPAMTAAGMILGTAAYMSPEQARGRIVDRRTDVWAFGCVLYEMLTGRRAFAGEDVTDTLAAVVRADPDWSKLPGDLSPTLAAYLKRCLHKDARQRVGDMQDVRLALDGAFDGSGQGPVAAAGRGAPTRAWMAGAALVAAAVTGVLVWIFKPSPAPPARPLSRVVLSAAPSAAVRPSGDSWDVAVTPDGRGVVYQSAPGQLSVRALEALESVTLRGPDTPNSPIISPDGAWVAFQAGNAGPLQRVPIQGGSPETICLFPGSLRGASWGRDGTIVFGVGNREGLRRVPAGGGEPTLITKPDDRSQSHIWPDVLPNGNGILFTVSTIGTSASDDQIAVLDLRTGEQRVIIESGTAARYAPSGHIVYALQGTLWAVAFDADRLVVTGDPVPIVEGVVEKATGAADFAISSTGSLVYVSGVAQANSRLGMVWVDRSGREEPLSLPPRAYTTPRVSPDGKRVAVGVTGDDGVADLWVYDVGSAAGRQLSDGGVANTPIWIPDGRIAFAFSASEGAVGRSQIYVVDPDGRGRPERLLANQDVVGDFPTSVTPDGRYLLFSRLLTGAHREVWQLALDGSHDAEPVLQGDFNRGSAELSPDGRWVVYRSNQSGEMEVYLQAYPGPAPAVPMSIGGGTSATWTPDRHELIYRLDDRVMAVPVNTSGGEVRLGQPKELFQRPYILAATSGGARQYHVAPDGRLLMLKEAGADADAQPRVVLVENWTEELKSRVPAN